MNTWTTTHFPADQCFLNTSVWTVIFVQVDGIKHLVLNLFCVFILVFIAAVIFHFQDADNLSSRFSKLNNVNVGISPSCKFNLKYYFTDRTCSTSNIHSTLICKGLRTHTLIYKGRKTHLSYTNAIFCELYIYLIYIYIEEKNARGKLRSCFGNFWSSRFYVFLSACSS